ncbi:glycosyltransferase [Paracidovorax wautersii]|uniref:GT2 family glycosyltransferase n=1 Tax=Paracidovorax wautersii TaxID=1177982 RepID=A0ABU1I880_9BURK|nr:glycosyltransferase [Paracidovorax wautersii]MDR6213427.1 GT2 family glycosyltransferase [Paracidovorax wautersii]
MHAGIFLHRIAQAFRAALERAFVGRIVTQAYFDRRDRRSAICFVAATRMREDEFWQKSLLGKRLKDWREMPGVRMRIAFENRRGLPAVYNEAIDAANASDVLVFIHDDAWLLHHDALKELWRGIRRFDLVGIAGNTRRLPGQFAWFLRQVGAGGTVLDMPYLSGAVHYGQMFKTQLNQFGRWPADCELLDGVFLAARTSILRRTRLRFDEQFDFHFYDLDFSRSARQRGLKVGTWPIHVLHASKGNLGDPKWQANRTRYFAKWSD